MAIEKQTTSNPLLQEFSAVQSEPMGEDYEVTEFDNGDIEFNFDPEDTDETAEARPFEGHFENLLEVTTDEDTNELNKVAGCVQEGFEGDKQSSQSWMETIKQGMSILGTRVEETNNPFPGACSAHHPLILEAAVKFQAKASSELFNPKGPVKTAVVGSSTPEKEAQAVRVKNHMNYQVQHQMEEYFDETENLLFYLPIVGSAFKKTYYDALLDRPVSLFVPVDQFIVNYYTTNLKTSRRFTHVIQRSHNELLKDISTGLYSDKLINTEFMGVRTQQGEIHSAVDELQGFHALADDDVHTLLEQYVYLDLPFDNLRDPDGIALPYVVTVEDETGKILSIRRNWREDDPLRLMICPFTHYKFVPGMGFYGLGYIHLLGNLQMTLTAAMRSLIDAGTFANLQGGFVDKRLRVRNNDGPIAPGEFKEVEAGGVELKNSIVLMPFKEPSQTMLAMYQAVEARSQKFADSAEQVIGDSTNYGPVGTTIALLEASSKFFSGVHKRLHQAQKNEFKIIAQLNFDLLGVSETYDDVGVSFDISKQDYDGRVDVIPVSDPNSGSQTQKMIQAQTIYTAALQNQAIHDMREVTKYYYGSIGVDEAYIQLFVPEPEEPQELDPLSDLLAVQQGKPIRAFQGQDHDSHIQIKTAFLQDPASGGSPAFQPLSPVIQANIQEHMLLKFQETIAGTVASIPPEQVQQGKEQFVTAQAAQKVAQTNQQLAAAQAQSPDQARMILAKADAQRASNETLELQEKIKNDAAERQFKALELSLNKYQTDTQMAIAQMNAQAKAQSDQMKQMMDLMKESMQIKATAESQDKNLMNDQIKTDKGIQAKQEEAKSKAEQKKTSKE